VPSPGPGEATNANVRGLYRWARTASEQTIPDGQGTSLLAWALKEAFALGNPDNFAQTMGYTHGGVVYPDRDAGGTDGPTACANCNSGAGPHATFVFGPNNPPGHPKAGEPVSFSGLSSTDAGAPITSYKWSFGPGRSGTGATDSVTFPTPGAYPVTLTVTDVFGKSSTTGQVVFVSGPGTKASEAGVPCNDNGADVGGIVLNVYLPSYAQNVRVANPGLPTTACNRTGHWTETIGPADPTRIDEWGHVKVNHQFTFICDSNCDPNATAPVFTLQWD
jgi:hypothetical protein